MNGFEIGTAAASLAASYEFYFGKENPMTTLAELNAQALEKRIAGASLSADQIKTRQAILKKCQSIAQYASWAVDPEEDYPLDMAKSLLEHAHELLDLAHEFQQAVKQ